MQRRSAACCERQTSSAQQAALTRHDRRGEAWHGRLLCPPTRAGQACFLETAVLHTPSQSVAVAQVRGDVNRPGCAACAGPGAHRRRPPWLRRQHPRPPPLLPGAREGAPVVQLRETRMQTGVHRRSALIRSALVCCSYERRATWHDTHPKLQQSYRSDVVLGRGSRCRV